MLPSILVFLIVLSLLIFIHELGHFLVAKKAGILVEEFGFGYPPKIFGIKIGETVYSLNWIPFGGFVRLFGQEVISEKKSNKKKLKRAFFKQSKKARVAVLLAGVTGNFLLGIFCFTIVYSKTGIPQKLGYVNVIETLPNSPAQAVGLTANDHIVAIDGQKVGNVEQFMQQVDNKKGQKVTLGTSRGNFELTVRENPPPEEGRLGVVITDTKMVFYSWWKMPFWSIWEGIKEALGWGALIVSGLVLTLKQVFSGVTPQVTGPVGIYQITSMVAKQGFLELVQFVGVLSINLAVLNIVPFPALDGAHLVFVFVGDWLGNKRRIKVEQITNAAGFAILIGLMLLVTANDILRLLKTVSLPNFLKPLSFLQSLFK